MPGIQDRAPTHTVEIRHRNSGFILVDRVVRVALAHIRTLVVRDIPKYLPVFAGTGIFSRIHPVALLQAKNPHFRIGEAPSCGCAGRASPNNKHVYNVVWHTPS